MIADDVSLIDTGAAVARQLQRLLAERDLLAQRPSQPVKFWTSGDPQSLRKSYRCWAKLRRMCKTSTCKKNVK